MEVRKNNGPYYRIQTSEKHNEATVMLYDYIGEYYDIDDDGEWGKAGVTDITFVRELERLAELYPVIHLRINSPGGEVYQGAAIVNAIRKCKAEVHTWNDGLAASMAALVWAAGKERHMAKNAMLMFHSGLWACIGNPKDMRDAADALDKMNEAMIAGMSDSTGIPDEELHRRYFADYADHWLTFKDAEKDGLINAMSEYDNPVKIDDPEALAHMNYKQLLAHFERTQHPDSPAFGERVRAAFAKAITAVTGLSAEARSAKADLSANNPDTADLSANPSVQAGNTQPIPSPSDIINMNLEEFKKSVGDGSLSLEDVKAFVAEQTQAAAPPPAAPAPAPVPATPTPETQEPATETKPNAELENLKAEIETLKGLVAQYGSMPGAGKSAPGMPATDLPAADGSDTPEARYKAMVAKMNDAADRNERLTVSPV